jgi:class 3 adenylate cyclase
LSEQPQSQPSSTPPVGSKPPGGSGSPKSLTPFIAAIKKRDLEALGKLRHALRTPLNQIIGYSEMCMETAEELKAPGLLADLKRIHAGGGQLLALINDALAPWKVEAGAIDLPALRRDVRAPLNATIGYAEICVEEAGLAKHEVLIPDLEKIRKAAQNLGELFDSTAYPEQISGGYSASQFGAVVDPGSFAHPSTVSATPFVETPKPVIHARILAVDDDPMNRDMLVRRLRKLGHTVDEAESGTEALQKLGAANYDLVLLDMLMPGLDGLQTLRRMKADPRIRFVPTVMLTALDDADRTGRCIEAGAEDYVPKPFNPIILTARINACLEKKRLRDQEQAYLAEIQTERAKTDRLLLNILPKAIADRLKAGEQTIVDSFSDCTVMFTDIVGFTRIAAEHGPQRTAQMLNEVFSNFDRIAEQFALEKVKTIGDAYMLVSGVPLARPDHAEACAHAALEMVEAMRVFSRRHKTDWQIRIGLNSGPVAAGILGTKKFAYDLWGDTVNIASRMESHGQPGKIQVSENTKKLLGEKFAYQPMGVIQIKNSSPQPTYLLTRKSA